MSFKKSPTLPASKSYICLNLQCSAIVFSALTITLPAQVCLKRGAKNMDNAVRTLRIQATCSVIFWSSVGNFSVCGRNGPCLSIPRSPRLRKNQTMECFCSLMCQSRVCNLIALKALPCDNLAANGVWSWILSRWCFPSCSAAPPIIQKDNPTVHVWAHLLSHKTISVQDFISPPEPTVKIWAKIRRCTKVKNWWECNTYRSHRSI